MTKREYKYHYQSVRAFALYIKKEFNRKVHEAYNTVTGLFVWEEGL